MNRRLTIVQRDLIEHMYAGSGFVDCTTYPMMFGSRDDHEMTFSVRKATVDAIERKGYAKMNRHGVMELTELGVAEAATMFK